VLLRCGKARRRNVSIPVWAAEPGDAPLRTHGRRRLVVIGGLSLGLGVAAVAGIAWYLSELLLRVRHSLKPYTIRIMDVQADTVTLERTPESMRWGRFGLDWPDGHAIIGQVVTAGIVKLKSPKEEVAA
jgi:hypothetical protein